MKTLSLASVAAIYRRELSAYFATPLAYVFIVVFLLLSGWFTFEIGQFFRRDQAELDAFFVFHRWLYLFLLPALAMRLWAEERKSGTIELLLTLPASTLDAVLAKFFAAWSVAGIALVLTLPIWFTVSWLGDPDNGVIFAAYLGSWLMAGSYLAVGSCISACTRNQVIAFILAAITCLVLVLIGEKGFFSWAPLWFGDLMASLSISQHFESIMRGVLDLRDLLFFIFFMLAWLWATALVIDARKAS